MTATASTTTGPPLGHRRAAPAQAALVLGIGTFMATLDTTVVAVGISTLTSQFGTGAVETQWVSTGYLLAVVTSLPASGWLIGRLGGRRAWVGAVLCFVVASALCGAAWSLPSLVAFRILQGMAGGVLPGIGQAVLAGLTGPGRRTWLRSAVAVLPMLAPVLGPPAGGAVLSVAGWPWLFYLNLPIGLVAVALALRLVPSDLPAVRAPGADPPAFDLPGAVLLSSGLAVAVLGLTEFERAGGVLSGSALVVAGAGLLTGFVLHGLWLQGVPLVDPRLFTTSPFGPAALVLAVLGLSLSGATFLLSLYLQLGRGLAPWDAGMMLVPQGIGAAVGAVLVSRPGGRAGPRTLVLTGAGMVLASMVVATQLVHSPPDGLVVLSLLVRGIGAALVGAPAVALVRRAMPPSLIPRAAAALTLLSTAGGAVGAALVAVILQDRLVELGPASAPAVAFGHAFWWVLGFCLVTLAGATRLPGRRPAPVRAQRPAAGRVLS